MRQFMKTQGWVLPCLFLSLQDITFLMFYLLYTVMFFMFMRCATVFYLQRFK